MTNSTRTRTILLWSLTIIITLGSVVYQRLTGPSYPVRGSVVIDGETVEYKLLRSYDTIGEAVMQFAAPSPDITGEMRYRRFRSHDEWTTVPLARYGDNLIAAVPKQPAAGKVMYQISLIDKEGVRHGLTPEPVIIRFKGPVPPLVLWPHILFMFTAMLISTRAGLEAIANRPNTYRIALWTAILLVLGGMIFGPIVQKFSFGEFWTGWPKGHDLTDNKTVIALIAWILALWRGRNRAKGRIWYIAASVVTLLIFLIPHSLLGSELDYTKDNM